MPVDSWSKTSGIAQNTWYDVLTLTGPNRIYYVKVYQDNDDNTNRNMEWSITVDGVSPTDAAQDAADFTNYWLYEDNMTDATLVSSTEVNYGFVLNANQYGPFDFANSWDLKVRTTSAVGTALKFYVDVRYAKVVNAG